MKVKYLIIILLSFLSSVQVFGQRVINDLESNVDNSHKSLDGDSAKSKKFVPQEVSAWVIDDIFGNPKPIDVDTLRHAYQNNSLTEGMMGQYNTLSNLGSPRQNRTFMNREENHNFIFLNPFDQFFVPTNRFPHYNTKSPFMNVSYNTCGSKTTGYDNLRVIYTQNIGKRTNFGASYSYMYGQGYYNSQNTGFMNTSVWASHKGDKYGFHFYYQYNYMKMAENGGITDEIYLTHPEDLSMSYGSKDIPTNIDNTWNRQEHHVLFFNHHYNIGFYRYEADSVKSDTAKIDTLKKDLAKTDSVAKRVLEFVPVMRFFHTLKLTDLARNYTCYQNQDNYYGHRYIHEGDSINDRTTSFAIRNTLGVSLCEGFQKWAAFGLNAYIGFDHRSYTLPDTLTSGDYFGLGKTERHKYTEYDLIVGGQMIRSQGHFVHYNVDAEFVLAGENIGQLSVSGHGELNIPFLKDTLQIAANAYIKNTNPSFYFRHFHTNYAWWDQSTSKEMRQRIQGVLTYPKTHTILTVGLENIKNYAYFADQGVYSETNKSYSHAPMALQCSDNIQVFSASLDERLKFGPLHFDNVVTYQTTSNANVLPLPALTTYTNLYLDFKIAKVLNTEIGGDMTFFTEYNAPDYSPIIGQFMTQNPDNTVKIGKHPLISVYANFLLKKLRFYVQYYHANKGTSRAFWAPYYPMNPTGIHFGLSWNFYD